MSRRTKIVVIIVAVIVALAGVAIAGFAVAVGKIGEHVRSRHPFALGWPRATTHPAVVAALGTPIDWRFSLRQIGGGYRWRFSSSSSSSTHTGPNGTTSSSHIAREEATIPMRGPRGEASLEAHAEDDGRGWRLTKLQVSTGEGTPPIDVLAP